MAYKLCLSWGFAVVQCPQERRRLAIRDEELQKGPKIVAICCFSIGSVLHRHSALGGDAACHVGRRNAKYEKNTQQRHKDIQAQQIRTQPV